MQLSLDNTSFSGLNTVYREDSIKVKTFSVAAIHERIRICSRTSGFVSFFPGSSFEPRIHLLTTSAGALLGVDIIYQHDNASTYTACERVFFKGVNRPGSSIVIVRSISEPIRKVMAIMHKVKVNRREGESPT